MGVGAFFSHLPVLFARAGVLHSAGSYTASVVRPSLLSPRWSMALAHQTRTSRVRCVRCACWAASGRTGGISTPTLSGTTRVAEKRLGAHAGMEDGNHATEQDFACAIHVDVRANMACRAQGQAQRLRGRERQVELESAQRSTHTHTHWVTPCATMMGVVKEIEFAARVTVQHATWHPIESSSAHWCPARDRQETEPRFR